MNNKFCMVFLFSGSALYESIVIFLAPKYFPSYCLLHPVSNSIVHYNISLTPSLFILCSFHPQTLCWQHCNCSPSSFSIPKVLLMLFFSNQHFKFAWFFSIYSIHPLSPHGSPTASLDCYFFQNTFSSYYSLHLFNLIHSIIEQHPLDLTPLLSQVHIDGGVTKPCISKYRFSDLKKALL